ncbi:hypothetical protein PRIPAC_70254, partial [Pristionchus pacificus]|uniref:Uncharacterized protein n=1 Tax=Pristionchus pacificus TaxID=54126 RepID=A0A2A6BDI2_PRIPA
MLLGRDAQFLGFLGYDALTIPIKEGEFGKPMSASHGYHIGPYIGASEKVSMDWRDGGVSMNRGFAVPVAGVSVNTGTGFGFPGAAKILQMWSALDPKSWTSTLAESVFHNERSCDERQ